jgi:geranylgeranyl diphosphate synthase, type I
MANDGVGDMVMSYRRAIDERISECVRAEYPRGFYQMMRYQLGIGEPGPVAELSHQRAQACPLLCVLTCHSVAGSGRDAIGAAAAIEMLVGWFQIHRDIEEHVPTSQGLPALWMQWGSPQAINTGDGMFSLAEEAILAAVKDPDCALTLTRELTEISLSHLEGRYRELTFQGRSSLPIEPRLEAIKLRSGALTGYSVWAGAVIGGAGDKAQHMLRCFGSELGTAWGIREEIERLNSLPGDKETGRTREPGSELLTDSASRYLNRGLDALRRADLSPSSERQLEALARELVEH